MTSRFSYALICCAVALVCFNGAAVAKGWTYRVIASTAPSNPQGFTSINGLWGLPVINDQGEVSFVAAADVDGIAVDGAWRATRQGYPKLLAVAPSGTLASDAAINRSGAISFGTETTGGQVESQAATVTQTGVTVFSTMFAGDIYTGLTNNGQLIVLFDGSLFLVTQSGYRPINTGYCDGGLALTMSGDGLVASPDCSNSGIYVTDTKTSRTKLLVGSGGVEGNVRSPAINDTGRVAFLGTAVPGQSGSNVNALYTAARDGKVSLLAFVNNRNCTAFGPPGGHGKCTYFNYGVPSISNSGAVVVRVGVTHWDDTRAHVNVILALNGDATNSRIISEGWTLDRCKIGLVKISPQAINADGLVTALLECDDGSERIIVATPSH